MRKESLEFSMETRGYQRCLSATKDVDIVIHAKHVSICEYNLTDDKD